MRVMWKDLINYHENKGTNKADTKTEKKLLKVVKVEEVEDMDIDKDTGWKETQAEEAGEDPKKE